MPENIRVELTYSGPEVESGSVPIEDMLDALAGFQGAIQKIATVENVPPPQDQIRVVGVEKGSAKILLDVLDWVKTNPAAAGVVGTVGTTAAAGIYKILKDLASVIRGKKASNGQTIYNYTFNNYGDVFGDLSLTKEQLELLQSGQLDDDLDRLTAPLSEGRGINKFELKFNDERVEVSADERKSLEAQAEWRRLVRKRKVAPQIEKRRAWLDGMFNSHSKRYNSGRFETTDGEKLKYRYIGGHVPSLLRAYVSRDVVKVFGTVQYEDGHPVSIDISDVQPTTSGSVVE